MDSDRGFFDWLTDSTRFTGTTGAIPLVGLGGLALGAGGRLVKNLLDLRRRNNAATEVDIPKLSPDTVDIPIEVTEEEAEELRKRGITVKRLMQKISEDRTSFFQAYDPSFFGGVGYGVLGGATAMAGWKLVDYLIDRARKNEVKSDIERTRRRIRSLLDDRPEVGDERAHAFMKAAEDMYFEGNVQPEDVTDPAMMTKIAVFPGWIKALSGGAVGVSALLALLGSYKKAMKASPVRTKLKAIRDAVRSRLARTPIVGLSPYARVRPPAEEDESDKVHDQLAAAIQARGVVPYEMETGGSPARQARAHAEVPSVDTREKEEEEEERPLPKPRATVAVTALPPATASAAFADLY